MGSLKRKEGPGATSTSKSTQKAHESRPTKRPKPSESKENGKSSAKNTKERRHSKGDDSKPSTAPTVSLLKEEEALFPRGGGSVLTPLEKKEIQIQAKNDVLFEQEQEPAATAGKKGEKGGKRKKRKTEEVKPVRDEDAVKIESLNYKRLVEGSLVLGTVVAVNPLDITIALPNNLVGHVPITSISDALTQRLQASANKEEEDDDDAKMEEDEAEDDLELKSLFRIGQYVRAYVVSTIDESATVGGKPKRRIELSLRPEHANSGLSAQDVVPNCTLMASVVSAEDHGFIMDLNIAGSNLQGFLPKKQIDKSIPAESLIPGSVLLCIATGKSANAKVVQLSTLTDKLGSVKNHPTDATTIGTFLPGTAVDVLVSDITQYGLVGKVMGSLDVTADLVHSGAGPEGVDLEDKYKIGSRVKARVICNFPTAKSPKLGISLLTHVVSMQTKVAKRDGKGVAPLEALPHASKVEKCKVQKVEPEIGLYVDVGISGVPGFVHISRVKDGKVDALFENSGPFKVGSVHPGRVVGYNPFDGMFLVSFEKSVLDQPFLRIEDIPVGAVVPGVIEKLLINESGFGIIVNVADGISGLVSEIHISDVHLQHPERKFKEGMKVKTRVLSTDPARQHLRLTLKKTLVNSDAPAIKSFDELKLGLQVPGTIVKLLQHGAIVQFYGSLRGFLPVSEMSEAFIQDPKEHFRVGQTVSVRIISLDTAKERLVVSCKDPKGSKPGQKKVQAGDSDSQKVERGMILKGRITKLRDTHITVHLNASWAGPVFLPDLADDFDEANPAKFKKREIVQVAVIDIDESNKKVRLSTRPSRVLNSSLPVKDREISKTSKLEVGEIIRGFVKNISDKGLFVSLGGDVTAMVQIRNLSDSFLKEWKDHFQLNQVVKGRIISNSEGRIELSLKQSAVDKDFVRLLNYSDFKEGQIVTGKVRKVEEYGAFIDIDGSEHVSGLCHRSEMVDRSIRNAKTLYNAGDKVKAKILSVDPQQKRINFGLKPSYFKDEDDDMDVDDDEGAPLGDNDSGDEEMSETGGAVLITGTDNSDDESGDDSDASDIDMADAQGEGVAGLEAGGFDWTASALDEDNNTKSTLDSDAPKKTKKRREPQIQVDKTAELDSNGPQTSSDFERLLLGQPNNSELWIQYMALQLKVSDLEAARKIAERAIKMINIKEETEKLNVWIAFLNLEVAYGTDESLEDVFKRACTYNDEQEVYERLASIYIQSGKHSVSISDNSAGIMILTLAYRKRMTSLRRSSRSSAPSQPMSGSTMRSSSTPRLALLIGLGRSSSALCKCSARRHRFISPWCPSSPRSSSGPPTVIATKAGRYSRTSSRRTPRSLTCGTSFWISSCRREQERPTWR
ncbi:hypothetical protein QBC47DRAFT_390592 [Echria macrotheca]|uniref:rRNA biogenesis protein RRP5 n=1 Tax=Echria macrotheca TaxID=438768 RepID=A0AAJ0B4N4_9PEZI|nr:hypothetical protein QBC47DRAFT_390592 [Echria macrotheca]